MAAIAADVGALRPAMSFAAMLERSPLTSGREATLIDSAVWARERTDAVLYAAGVAAWNPEWGREEVRFQGTIPKVASTLGIRWCVRSHAEARLCGRAPGRGRETRCRHAGVSKGSCAGHGAV